MHTQIIYGTNIRDIILLLDQIEAIAHIPVARSKKTSIKASRLFLNPNCSGVNKKLKNKFTQNGNAVFQDMLLLISI